MCQWSQLKGLTALCVVVASTRNILSTISCCSFRAVVDKRRKSQFEKRKRNLKTISPISRGEREIWIPCHSFEKRKRNLKSISLISRGEREIWIPFPQFREEKEKSDKIFSTFEKRKRNFIYISTISRREREYWNSFLLFLE